jgi:hypothetical protein
MRIFILLLSLVFISEAHSEAKDKTIYQYKKYEKFDLGNLEVKGELVAPGDISVRERERKRFEMQLESRRDFERFIEKDIQSLR